MDEIMKIFEKSLKSLNERDLEIVSRNLHNNNLKIEEEVRISLTKPQKRVY